MLLVASTNGQIGFDAAVAAFAGGGSLLDAVEVAVRVVEDNADDHTVGLGGYPNLLGEVELDASIMEGATRRTGAVGALRGYRQAITVARAVMERLPHVLVVGDGAGRLAAELDLEPCDLLTPEAEKVWRDGIEGRLPAGGLAARMLSQVAAMAADPEHAAGTVNVIGWHEGRIVSGVSTSGWAWKYPGRLGDSPVIGAGNYADDRYGAAACTGFGELAIRAGSARSIVAAMAGGAAVADACVAAVHDLAGLVEPGEAAIMNIVAVDRDGHHAAVSTRAGANYAVWEDGGGGSTVLPRIHVPLE